MLSHLTIKNYVLIHHLEMDLSDCLNVITGETGTGKSIMLGALGLLLGNRADAKVLYDESKKCIVEGVFKIGNYKLNDFFDKENVDYDDITILRREVAYNGKSRAFINDTPVMLKEMRKIGLKLMNIHSQHETIDLKNHLFKLQIIDVYVANQACKKAYQLAWEKFMEAKKNYHNKLEETHTLQQETDLVTYQLEELNVARLETIEQEQLEDELRVMEHAEEIKRTLNTVLNKIGNADISIDTLFAELRSLLKELSPYLEKYTKLYERFESLWIELQDIAAEVRQEEHKIDYDAKKTEEARERLDLIHKLLHKHKCSTVAQLLLLEKELQDKVDKVLSLDSTLALMKKTLYETSLSLKNKAEKLSQSRIGGFKGFCEQITKLLQELGIPHAKLKVTHCTGDPGPTGIDNIDLLFSANKGVDERPLAQTASGGEFSRLMFCIRYVLAKKIALPTLILDEIDAGISGEIAIRMGTMMKTMARQCQLIAISHLPQIAAKSDRHFCAYKKYRADKTISDIKHLDEREHVTEIAKMISGDKPTSAATESARELMKR